MAGWMWLRCVLGPHLQRIHRSPDQSRLEGRAGRRVGIFTVSCICLRTADCEIQSFNVDVAPAAAPGSVKCCVIETLLSLRW